MMLVAANDLAVTLTATGQQPSAGTGTLEDLRPLEDPGWDQLVLTHPGASIFHSAGWARVLNDAYGQRPCYLGRREGSRLAALAAVMECRRFPYGRTAVGLPGADRCPLLSSPGIPVAEVMSQVAQRGRERGWRYVELRGLNSGSGTFPPSVSFHSHHVDLEGPRDRLFAGFKSSVRRAIRKSEREGVRVTLTQDAESVRTYYRLHCLTRRRHGLPPQPFGLFRAIHRHLISRDLGFTALAAWQGHPIAGAIFFHFGDQALYKFAASDMAYQHLRANDLVVWEGIRRLAGRVKSLDFGRTSLMHTGLRRFKLGFGSRESITSYYRYDFRMRRFVVTKDWASGIHNRIFGLMPIPLLRMVGNLLYRNMAIGVTLHTLKYCVLES